MHEALINVSLHARARNCTVRIYCPDGERRMLTVEISEDGIGLPDSPKDRDGPSSMRGLAAELGGTCEVATAPVGGTRVFARLPLNEAPPKETPLEEPEGSGHSF